MDVFVGALTFVVEVVSRAIDVFRQAIEPLSSIFDGVKAAISLVWAEIQKLGAMFGFASNQSQQAGGTMGALGTIAQFLGFAIGNVAAFIAGAIGPMVQFVVRRLAIVVAAFRSVVGFIQGVIDIVAGIVTGDWARVWTGFKNVVLNVINFVAQLVLGFVETVAGAIDSIAGIFGADLGTADAIRELREDIEKGLTGGDEVATAGVDVRPTAAPGATTAAFPAATAAEANFAALERAAGGGPPVRVETPPVTTHVNLTVDGEVLARAVARAERGGAARSFGPVPVLG